MRSIGAGSTVEGGGVLIGQSIGHYRITRQLGTGGMGDVYGATDTRLQREVAIKFLRDELAADAMLRARFEREAQIAAALSHPNIVAIHSVEEVDGHHLITMEMVQGQTLSQLIPEIGFPLDRLLELARPITDALSYSHERGVTHRDLKPGNIMVDERGVVKVLDFGLAQLRRSEAEGDEGETKTPLEQTITVPGAVMGTLPYMSPEQVRGRPADPRSDVFALGVVFYEMATGRRPFTGDSMAEKMSSILRDDPRSVTALNPQCPTNLSRLIKRCMAKDPDDRFRTAGEVREALRNLHNAPASALLPSERPSVAVLPFTDMSPESDHQHVCDGIAEEISTSLTKVSGLRVVARSAAFSQRELTDVREIGEILNVGNVVQGSLRLGDDRIRVTVELSETNDGYQVWSEAYDREAGDLFAVQDEIAVTIAGRLRGQLLSAERDAVVKRHTLDPEAHGLYLRGRFHWNRRYAGGFQKAMECFQQALEIDPRFALPHIGLADCFAILGFYNLQPPAVAFPKARSAARYALELDEELAEAHATIGLISGFFDWDWKRAEASMMRSLELNPEHPMTNFWFAFLEMCLGRPRQSLRRIADARAADPLSLIINSSVGYLHYLNRESERGAVEIQKVLEMDPGFGPGLWFLGLCYIELERFEEAAEVLDDAVRYLQGQPLTVATRGVALARSGRREEAEEILEQLAATPPTGYPPPYFLAALALALGRRDDAFHWLERAYNDRNNWLVYLNVDPFFDDLRGTDELADLIGRIGLDQGLDGSGPSWVSALDPTKPG